MREECDITRWSMDEAGEQRSISLKSHSDCDGTVRIGLIRVVDLVVDQWCGLERFSGPLDIQYVYLPVSRQISWCADQLISSFPSLVGRQSVHAVHQLLHNRAKRSYFVINSSLSCNHSSCSRSYRSTGSVRRCYPLHMYAVHYKCVSYLTLLVICDHCCRLPMIVPLFDGGSGGTTDMADETRNMAACPVE